MFRSLLLVGFLLALLGGPLGCQSGEKKEPIKADPNAPKQRFPPPTPDQGKG